MARRSSLLDDLLTALIGRPLRVGVTVAVAVGRVQGAPVALQTDRPAILRRAGTRITLSRRIGGNVSGNITSLGQDTVALDGKTFHLRELTSETCEAIFAHTYATKTASSQVQRERDAYRSRSAQAEKASLAAIHQRRIEAEKAERERQAELRSAREQADAAALKEKFSSAQLVLFPWHWSEDSGYVTVEGQVGNITHKKLDNVMALVSFYTADGTLITSDSALVEYNPIMPKQVSPFKVMATSNPLMKSATIGFKTLWGTKLNAVTKEEFEELTK